MCTTAAFLTAYYSCRLLVISFARVKNSEVVVRSSHIPLQFISTPLILLAYLSVFVGYFFKDIFVGFGCPFFLSSISTSPFHDIIVDTEFLFSSLKFLPVLFSLLGFTSAFFTFSLFGYSKSIYFCNSPACRFAAAGFFSTVGSATAFKSKGKKGA